MSDESLKPVILITGLPREGKTLFAVSKYLKGRPKAFSAGLNGSVFPTVNAEEWYKTPEGSLIVVDEAWKFFPPVSPTAKPPEHYAKIPEIGHTGHVIVLITQHPNDLDARIRRRVGKHYHVVRVFGSERANIHEWNHCEENTDNRADTESFIWEYDKTSYNLYKSATEHRVKIEIPRRLKRIPIYLAIAGVMLAGGIYTAWSSLGGGEKDATPAVAEKAKPGIFDRAFNPGLKPLTQNKPEERRPMTANEYVKQYSARFEGMPHTAPIYDELTKPVRVPVAAACVYMPSVGCKCYTQQATPVAMPDTLCKQMVKQGSFVDFDADPQAQSSKPARAPNGDDLAPKDVTSKQVMESPYL